MTCNNVISLQDMENDKKHSIFYREVITGKSYTTGANIDSATNAVTGQTQRTLPNIVNNIDWTPVGLFADGVTFTKITDFAIDAVGTQWIYTGSYPFTATAGTVPTEPTYQAVHVNDHGQLSNLNAAVGHDVIYSREFNSVADAISYSGHAEGNKYVVNDYYGGVTPNNSGLLFFKVVASGTGVSDGGEYIDIDANFQLKQKLKVIVDAKSYGAMGNGINNDQPPIQSATDYATKNGGGVIIPPGYYRLQAPVNIGAPFYNNNNDVTFIRERLAQIDDPTDIANQNQVNKAANALLKRIDFKGTSSTYFIAAFYPSVYMPVIAYNLDNDSFDNAGSLENINVIAESHYINGKYDPSPSCVYSDNRHVGVYTGRGCSVTKKVMAAGLGVGYMSHRQYWTSADSIKVYNGGDGVHLSAYNQAKASNLNIHTCLRGYIFDGQAGEIDTFGTENCDEELVILSADTCRFSTAYLEDVRTFGGDGKFSVTLGHTANNPDRLIVHSTFDNILILNTLGSVKKAIKFNSCDQSTLTGCRAYGGDVVTDTTSLCRLDGCDFSIEQFYVNSMLRKGFAPELKDSSGNSFVLSGANGVVSIVGALATINFDITWTSKGSAISVDPVIITFDRVYPTMLASSSVFVSGLTASNQIHARSVVGSQFFTLKKVGAGAATELLVSDLSTSGSLSFSISLPVSLFN